MSFIRRQERRGTAALWTSVNPILASGEIGVETDTLKSKIGDGSTAWVSLGYTKGVDQTARDTANSAASDAGTAQGAADAAQGAADAAQSAANVANSTANTGLSLAGTANATANAALPKAGGQMTGAIKKAQGSNIASAATVNLAIATGNAVSITGTVTITAFGTVTAGAEYMATFTGTGGTLTHNATSLILPAAADITWAIGDSMRLLSLGSGNWRVVSYTRANGKPLACDKTLAGLGNVDNTSDANKPVSSAQASAIAAKWDVPSNTATLALLSGTESLLFNGNPIGGSGNGIPVANTAARLALTVDTVQLRTLVFQQDTTNLYEAVNLEKLDTEQGWFLHGHYNSAPYHITNSQITGTPNGGMSVASVAPGGWPTPTISAYSWQVSTDAGATWETGIGTSSGGGTGYTAHISEIVEGALFKCVVTLTNTFGTDSEDSNVISYTPIAPILGTVTLTGLYDNGTTETAPIDETDLGVTVTLSNTPSPSPDTTYLWKWHTSNAGSPLSTGTPVPAPGVSNYVPVAGDAGHYLACVITVANSAGSDTKATAWALAGIPPTIESVAFLESDLFTTSPVSVGGEVFAVGSGTLAGAEVTYAWLAGPGGSRDGGADPSYTILNDDNTLACTVNWANLFGQSELTGGPTPVQSPPYNTVAPAIQRVGDVLSFISEGTWARTGTRTYEWWLVPEFDPPSIVGAASTYELSAPSTGESYYAKVIEDNAFGDPTEASSNSYIVP